MFARTNGEYSVPMEINFLTTFSWEVKAVSVCESVREARKLIYAQFISVSCLRSPCPLGSASIAFELANPIASIRSARRQASPQFGEKLISPCRR